MAYDYSKLRGKIIEVCKTTGAFAKEMGLSERTVSLKLNNKVGWKQAEIEKAADILHFSRTDIISYFFVPKV